MIHIIDNGYPYSDHAIYFVETKSDAEANLLDRFLAMAKSDGYSSGFKRIACAPEVTWFERVPMQFAIVLLAECRVLESMAVRQR